MRPRERHHGATAAVLLLAVGLCACAPESAPSRRALPGATDPSSEHKQVAESVIACTLLGLPCLAIAIAGTVVVFTVVACRDGRCLELFEPANLPWSQHQQARERSAAAIPDAGALTIAADQLLDELQGELRPAYIAASGQGDAGEDSCREYRIEPPQVAPGSGLVVNVRAFLRSPAGETFLNAVCDALQARNFAAPAGSAPGCWVTSHPADPFECLDRKVTFTVFKAVENALVYLERVLFQVP